jgi:hypothetical protein
MIRVSQPYDDFTTVLGYTFRCFHDGPLESTARASCIVYHTASTWEAQRCLCSPLDVGEE